MSEEEIEELKRKHRNEEDRQLTRADLEYLKALFDRLEQEKKQAVSGTSAYQGSDSSIVSYVVDLVPEVEMTDADLGECIDVSV